MLIRALAISLAAAAPLLAQHDHDTDGMHHSASVSAAAKKQIDSVAKAVIPLNTLGAVNAAGFHSAFGWIPTMGEHWVSRGLMMNGRQTNRATPSQLMFSKIAGKDSLVGAAYGYITAVGDTVRPALFDGAPAWHEHRDLAPEGLTLVMLHVWFVPSPDGPFAGTNPNLPFWALGLNAPDSERMKDAAFKSRAYRASLALAEVADTTSIFPTLKARPQVSAAIAARRDSVRAIVAELRAADKAKDAARWDRAADKAAKQWDGMAETYLASARTADGHARIERYINMMLGEHVH